MLPGERELWARMSGPDRRHAVGVARGTLDQLGTDEPGPEVVASALLHDVGKIESDLGTFARVGVTLLAMALGRTRLVRSTQQQGLQAKIRLYLTHDRVGADLLRRAGSHDLTVSWAEQHHLPPDRWTVEPRLAHALKTADGD